MLYLYYVRRPQLDFSIPSEPTQPVRDFVRRGCLTTENAIPAQPATAQGKNKGGNFLQRNASPETMQN